MRLYEIKDIVRAQVGQGKLDEPVLDWCIRRGLREIEKRDNFYWMEADAQFNVYEDQQDYSVTAPNGVGISDHKETDVILVSDRTATDPEWCPVVGPEETKLIKTSFTDGKIGPPAFWSMDGLEDDAVLRFWPPRPERDYLAQIYYWKWTELPRDTNSNSHEVLRRWPEALIYLATEQGVMETTKDTETAMFWRLKFDNPGNELATTEYKKIKLYQQARKNKRRFRDAASSNGSTNADRSTNARKAWF